MIVARTHILSSQKLRREFLVTFRWIKMYKLTRNSNQVFRFHKNIIVPFCIQTVSIKITISQTLKL